MFRFCVKYWLKHINEFTIDEITKERDLELTGLGKKARGVSDVTQTFGHNCYNI
jgi:hypothetical protein